jgi:integrase
MQNERNRYGEGSISPKGNTWQGRFHVDGRQVKRSLGKRREVDSEGLTPKQARRKLREVEAEYKPPTPGSAITFKEVATACINRKEAMGLAERTIYDYRRVHGRHFYPEFGERPIGEISSQDIDRLQQKLLRKLSKKSVKTYLTILHGDFAYAVKEGYREENPCDGVERPKLPKETELHVLFSGDLAAVIRKIPNDDLGEVEKRLYPFSAKSGLRQAESTKRLRWRHLDFPGRTIRVLGKTKSTRGRTVPMAADVRTMLEQWREVSNWSGDDDLVFAHPSTGERIDSSTILQRFQRCVLRAGVGEFKINHEREGKIWPKWPLTTFHDLRHSFATACAMAGVPLRKLMEWMGHADIQTTMIYAHYYPSEDEADMLDQALGNVLNKGAQSGAQSAANQAQDEATATESKPL